MQRTGAFSVSSSFLDSCLSSLALDFFDFFFFFLFCVDAPTSIVVISRTSPASWDDVEREEEGISGVADNGGVEGRLCKESESKTRCEREDDMVEIC